MGDSWKEERAVMQDFERLMLAIYEGTIAADRLFVGHDVLMTELGLDKLAFSRLHGALSRKGFLNPGAIGMERLSTSGIEYVENRLR